MPNVKKLRKVVLERLACGEDADALRAQLAAGLDPAAADEIIGEAKSRLEQGRGQPEFERALRKIRKRRLVGHRYLIWKIIGGVMITLSALSTLVALMLSAGATGSIMGMLVGGILLAAVEMREHSLMSAGEPDVEP